MSIYNDSFILKVFVHKILKLNTELYIVYILPMLEIYTYTTLYYTILYFIIK
jgi:hypothetical protein